MNKERMTISDLCRVTLGRLPFANGMVFQFPFPDCRMVAVFYLRHDEMGPMWSIMGIDSHIGDWRLRALDFRHDADGRFGFTSREMCEILKRATPLRMRVDFVPWEDDPTTDAMTEREASE